MTFSKKDWNIIGLSVLVIVLALSVALQGNFLASQERQQLVNRQWTRPSIGFADLERSGDVSHEIIVESTDFSRKIVNFQEGVSESEKEQLIESLGGEVVKQIDTESYVVKLSEDNLAETEQALKDDDSVANTETDYAVSLLSTPDWGVQKIRADEVWEESRAGGIRVAVIDTGIDTGHPEFSGKYAAGYDFVNNDDDPQDDHGHGTAVSGIAAAAQNGSGTIGVGPDILLMVAKVLNAEGIGYISDVVSGIDWSVENGASVINLSLGTTYDSTTLKSVVDRAVSNGAVVIAAAGNTGGGNLTYPAAYDSVVAVGAIDQEDRLASFSAVGSELVAPGVGITAPWIGGYTTISGTSASSPHVAGVAAHLIATEAGNVREALRKGVVDLGDEGKDPYYGYGLTDAVLALGLSEEDEEVPTVRFISPTDGQRISGNIVVNIAAEDNKGILKVDLVVDDRFVYSSARSSYRWLWDLSATPSGTHRLTAKAYDEAGNIGEESISVEVVGGLAPQTSPGQNAGSEQGQEAVQDNAPAPAIEKLPSEKGPSNLPSQGRGRGRVQGTSTDYQETFWMRFIRTLFNL